MNKMHLLLRYGVSPKSRCFFRPVQNAYGHKHYLNMQLESNWNPSGILRERKRKELNRIERN